MTELSYPPLDPALAPRAPEFGQPVPLLTFSYTPAHEQVFDDRALRFLAPSPPRGADLRHGYARWIRKPDTKGRLDGLLRALSHRRAETREEIKVGVCTWRGVMTKYALRAVRACARR
jgi:RAT1-interacting protein